jgi:hypothetical protein
LQKGDKKLSGSASWLLFHVSSLQNKNADDTLHRLLFRLDGNNPKMQFNKINAINVFTAAYSKRIFVITQGNNTHKHSLENVDSHPLRVILLQSWKISTDTFFLNKSHQRRRFSWRLVPQFAVP